MKHVVVAVVVACLPVGLPTLRAGEMSIKPTTEFGITITPEQIFDAVYETHEFWPPVQRYIASEKFTAADVATRAQTAELIKSLNRRLADRMLGDDEAAALELVHYLGNRLRLFHIYARLQVELNDELLAIAIKDLWDEELDRIHALEPHTRQERLHQLTQEMDETLHGLGLPAGQIADCLAKWELVAQITFRLYDSPTGKLLAELEHQARQKSPEAVGLAREVIKAADWASITKTSRAPIKRVDFERAWRQMEQARQPRLAEADSPKRG